MPFKDREKAKSYQKSYKEKWNKKNPNYNQDYYQKNQFIQRISHRLKNFKKKTDRLKQQYKITKSLWDDPVITGCILSDAYLRKIDDGQNSCFELEQSEKHKELVTFLEDYFTDLGIQTGTYRYLHKAIRENDLPKWGIRVFTRRSKFWTLMRKRWYPDGVKVIPKDLVITPKTLAFIFMGDGTSSWNDVNNHSSSIIIHTEGFDHDSVMLLKNKLYEYGIEIINTQIKPNLGEVIRISRAKDVKKFMNLVQPFMLSSFNYKVKIPKSVGRKPYGLIKKR